MVWFRKHIGLLIICRKIGGDDVIATGLPIFIGLRISVIYNDWYSMVWSLLFRRQNELILCKLLGRMISYFAFFFDWEFRTLTLPKNCFIFWQQPIISYSVNRLISSSSEFKWNPLWDKSLKVSFSPLPEKKNFPSKLSSYLCFPSIFNYVSLFLKSPFPAQLCGAFIPRCPLSKSNSVQDSSRIP